MYIFETFILDNKKDFDVKALKSNDLLFGSN